MSWRLLPQHEDETEDDDLYEFSGDEDDRLRHEYNSFKFVACHNIERRQ